MSIGSVQSSPTPRAGASEHVAGPGLPDSVKFFHLGPYGLSAVHPQTRMAVGSPLPGFTHVEVTSTDGATLHSHSRITENGDISWGMRSAEPNEKSYGQVPQGKPVRITLEHPDGWYTAVVHAPSELGAGRRHWLQQPDFQWISRPTLPTPASAPQLKIRPENLLVGASTGLGAYDTRGPSAALKEPLPGFTAVEVKSMDGKTTHSWSDVSDFGNIGWPRKSQDDSKAIHVPANEGLQIILHHPQGQFIGVVPPARGNDVLRSPYGARSLAGVTLDWHPTPLRARPTNTVADVLDLVAPQSAAPMSPIAGVPLRDEQPLASSGEGLWD